MTNVQTLWDGKSEAVISAEQTVTDNEGQPTEEQAQRIALDGLVGATFPLLEGVEDNHIFRPGETAKMFEVKIRTLHRWEELGKIASMRTVGGHRRYSARAIRKAFGNAQIDQPKPEHLADAPQKSLDEVSETAPEVKVVAEKLLLTPLDVSKLFGVNPKTVTRWSLDGKINAVKTVGGHRRYTRKEIERLLVQNNDDSESS